MRRYIDIKTPEGVTIEYELAGIGSRFGAVSIDMFLQVIVNIAMLIPLALMQRIDMLKFLNNGGEVFFIILNFIIYWGYYIIFEIFMNGKTPGKKLFGLRTIKENGRAMNIGECVARNLFRIIDNILGIFPMFFSSRYKRFGDYVAGTIVIKERKGKNPVTIESLLEESNFIKNKTENVESGQNGVRDGFRIDNKEYRVLKDFLERRSTIRPGYRSAMAHRLCEYFKNKFCINERINDPEKFLEEIAKNRIQG